MRLEVISVAPYFILTALYLALARGILRISPFFRRLVDAEEAGTRFHSIDGLRGFLALGVFFHHAVITYFYYASGTWTLPPSRFYALIGQLSTAMFFMVTAFLFWGRIAKSGSRFDVRAFFWSRLCRMAPMYFVSVAAVLCVAFSFTHFRMQVTPMDLARQTFSWLSFTALGTPDVNGFTNTWLLNTVYWSLPYEWKFYFFVPFGLLFARGLAFAILAITSGLIVWWFSPTQVEWNFIYGAVAAALAVEFEPLKRLCRSRLASIAAAVALVGTFITQDGGYGPLPAFLLFTPFLLIANGNDFFGLLTSRPARMLGAASYSMYLIHNLILYCVFRLMNHWTNVAGVRPLWFWLVVAVSGIAVVLISALTYRYFEHPFLKRKVPRWLSPRAGYQPAVASRSNAD